MGVRAGGWVLAAVLGLALLAAILSHVEWQAPVPVPEPADARTSRAARGVDTATGTDPVGAGAPPTRTTKHARAAAAAAAAAAADGEAGEGPTRGALHGSVPLPIAAHGRRAELVLHVARLPGGDAARGVETQSLRGLVQADGSWRLDGLEAGTYVVQLALDGAALSGARRLAVGPGERVAVALPTQPVVAVTGEVVDEATGEPLADAQVLVAGWMPSRTGAAGRFALHDLPAGVHQMLVSAAGFVPAEVPVTVPARGPAAAVVCRVARGVSLTLRVSRPGGAPAPGVAVTVSSEHHAASAVSGSDGSVVVAGLAPGARYDVRVQQLPGDAPVEVTLPAPEAAHGIHLQLR